MLPRSRDEGLNWYDWCLWIMRRRGVVNNLRILMLEIVGMRIILLQIGRLLMREAIIRDIWIVVLRLVKLVMLHDCLATLGMMDLSLYLLVALK